MSDVIEKPPSTAEKAARIQRFKEACALQEIEGNPLDAEQIEMFDMFERENWSEDRIHAHLMARAKAAGSK